MTWNDWHDFLKPQEKRLRGFQTGHVFDGRRMPRAFHDFTNMMDELEFSVRESLDQSVISFAGSGKWPRHNALQNYFLRHRVTLAQDVVQLMLSCLVVPDGRNFRQLRVVLDPDPSRTREEMIVWLLKEQWFTRGLMQWNSRLDGEYRHLVCRAIDWREKLPDAFAS